MKFKRLKSSQTSAVLLFGQCKTLCHLQLVLLRWLNFASMRFLALFVIVYLVVVFQSDWDTDLKQHINSQSFFSYHEPTSFTNNSINHYSVIHFFQYAVVSIIKFFNVWHIIIISILWEIFELYTHFEWGRESWLNKFCDLIFNVTGFYFGRTILRKIR